MRELASMLDSMSMRVGKPGPDTRLALLGQAGVGKSGEL